MYPFFFKMVHHYFDKTESCVDMTVVFSQNCCFVANSVDKALVDDSTNAYTLIMCTHCRVNKIIFFSRRYFIKTCGKNSYTVSICYMYFLVL